MKFKKVSKIKASKSSRNEISKDIAICYSYKGQEKYLLLSTITDSIINYYEDLKLYIKR